MVQQGQFLERAVTIQVGNIVIEGLYHKGKRGGAVIAPPHPLFGGSMDNPVVSEIVYALFKMNYSTLRFNYRGVGASQGKISEDPEKSYEDYLAATLQEMENTGEKQLLGAGYSFGAYITLLVYSRSPYLHKMILISPPTTLFSFSFETIKIPTLIISGEKDKFLSVEKLKEAEKKNPFIDLKIIKEADHFFSIGLAEIGKSVEEWLKNQ